jgi:hypothetical protein
MPISDLLAAFPIRLFMVLFGVTLFFGLAAENGTLPRLADKAMRLARGNFAVIAGIFFLMALGFATIGPGNIGAVALLAPLAMAAAGRTGMGAFFMTLILISGANAGTFSPFSPTGIIAGQAAGRIGLHLSPWKELYLPNLIAHGLMALSYSLVFWPALERRASRLLLAAEPAADRARLTNKQNFTLFSILFFVGGAVIFRADVGFLAISLAAGLMLFDAGDAKLIGKVVPWNVIMMVCGVSTLVQVCERLGAMVLFTDFLTKIADPSTAPAVLGWTAGMVSIYSSSSGVVMPTFIPLVPALIEKMGGGSPEALVASINLGSHIVDASPLSTLGALCIASAPPHVDRAKLFRRLLICGLLMSFYGAIVCYVLFGVFADRLFTG